MNNLLEIEQNELKSGELSDIEQQLIKSYGYQQIPINDKTTDDTLNFLDECRISIFDFKKGKNNKIKLVNKPYKLFQYGLSVEHSFIYIENFAKLSDITKFLESKGINISIKKLIKNKIFKIELS